MHIKMRPEAPGVWAKEWIPIIGNCRLGNGQGCHSMEGPGRGWNPYPGASPTTGLLVAGDPSTRTCLRIMYNMPHSRPHPVAFYYMQGEGCLLLPISSTGTYLLDLRPEAGYTFAPFRRVHKFQKKWVSILKFEISSVWNGPNRALLITE